MTCLDLSSSRLFSNNSNNREGHRCDSQSFQEENLLQLRELYQYILTQVSSEVEERMLKKVSSSSLLTHIYLVVVAAGTISRATSNRISSKSNQLIILSIQEFNSKTM